MTFDGEVGFQVFRNIFMVMMTLGMMASLSEFRFGAKKLMLILLVYLCWVGVSCAGLILLGGDLLLLRMALITVSAPAVFLTYWTAKDSPAPSVFNYMSQIMVSLLASAFFHVITRRFGLSMAMDLLMRCAFYLTVIYLEWRFLRKKFRRMVAVLPKRWGILMPIPCAFCAYMMFVGVWPQSYLDNPEQAAHLFAMAVPMATVYIGVFKSLSNQYRIQMERQNNVLMELQVSALKQRLQAMEAAEEELRIVRHDMRHNIQTVAALLERGETQAAVRVLGAAQKNLDETQVRRWCKDPVLDAVFSYYGHLAEMQHTAFEAQLSFPDELPVEVSELSTVLANALENALYACASLPKPMRAIHCTAIGTPSLMLEISNPCAQEVTFDDNGLPVARDRGHGFGVRSISIFCKKHAAVCQFEARDGWFVFRMVL